MSFRYTHGRTKRTVKKNVMIVRKIRPTKVMAVALCRQKKKSDQPPLLVVKQKHSYTGTSNGIKFTVVYPIGAVRICGAARAKSDSAPESIDWI